MRQGDWDGPYLVSARVDARHQSIGRVPEAAWHRHVEALSNAQHEPQARQCDTYNNEEEPNEDHAHRERRCGDADCLFR